MSYTIPTQFLITSNPYIEFYNLLSPTLDKILTISKGNQCIIDKYSQLIISFIKTTLDSFLIYIPHLCKVIDEYYNVYPSSGLLQLLTTIIRNYKSKFEDYINLITPITQKTINTLNTMYSCIENPDIIDEYFNLISTVLCIKDSNFIKTPIFETIINYNISLLAFEESYAYQNIHLFWNNLLVNQNRNDCVVILQKYSIELMKQFVLFIIIIIIS